MRRLIDLRINVCANSIKLYRHGKQNDSLAIVNNDDGKRIMDEIRPSAASAMLLSASIAFEIRLENELSVAIALQGEDDVLVTVSDDGCGIPRENMEKVFEPFFTTKKEVGTGPGLWITKGIVERIGGSIRIANNNERAGTRIEVILPASAKEATVSA